MLCLLRGGMYLWKCCHAFRAASADRIKHITPGPLHQRGVTATHLSPTPDTGVYVPHCEGRITERAFYVGVEKMHCSILLQKCDQEAHHRTDKIDIYLMTLASFSN
jgi:hypothetical protein